MYMPDIARTVVDVGTLGSAVQYVQVQCVVLLQRCKCYHQRHG